jgi:hypothetical protein
VTANVSGLVPGDHRDPLQNRELKYKPIFNWKRNDAWRQGVVSVGPHESPSKTSSFLRNSAIRMEIVWIFKRDQPENTIFIIQFHPVKTNHQLKNQGY